METLARSCSASIKERYGFIIEWEIIIALVEWLMAECFQTEASFLEACEDPTRFQMFILRWRSRQLLRRTFRWRDRRRAANALTDVVLETASNTPANKLRAVFDECQ